MTTEEIRELLAQTAELQRQTALEIQESRREAERRAQEVDQRAQETDRWAQERAQEADRRAQERAQEADRRIQETDRQLRELGKQLGGLGAKFGGFTEGMAFPSMQKILNERFGMNVITPRVIARNNGRILEMDVVAFSNANLNEVYVVEVKSHLREDGLEQMKKILREFRDFVPGHQDKKLYGILAAVDIPTDIAERVLREGIYLATIHDEEFELVVPEGFQPRAF